MPNAMVHEEIQASVPNDMVHEETQALMGCKYEGITYNKVLSNPFFILGKGVMTK